MSKLQVRGVTIVEIFAAESFHSLKDPMNTRDSRHPIDRDKCKQ